MIVKAIIKELDKPNLNKRVYSAEAFKTKRCIQVPIIYGICRDDFAIATNQLLGTATVQINYPSARITAHFDDRMMFPLNCAKSELIERLMNDYGLVFGGTGTVCPLDGGNVYMITDFTLMVIELLDKKLIPPAQNTQITYVQLGKDEDNK